MSNLRTIFGGAVWMAIAGLMAGLTFEPVSAYQQAAQPQFVEAQNHSAPALPVAETHAAGRKACTKSA